MVTVTAALKRTSAKGDFMVLELMSGIEMIQSQVTGKFYATARKCTVPSSFSENVAMAMIGSQIPGTIERVQSDAYEFTIKDTGEIVKLTHTYQYRPENATAAVSVRTLPAMNQPLSALVNS